MVKLKQPIPKKKMPLPGGAGPSKPPTPKRPDAKAEKAPSAGGNVVRLTPAPTPGPRLPPDVARRVIDKGREVGMDEPFTISLAQKRAMQELLARPPNEELPYLVDPEAQRVLRFARQLPGIVDAALRIAKSPKAAFDFLLADGIALADEVIAQLLAAEGIDLTPFQPQPDPCSPEEWWCTAPVVHVTLKQGMTLNELAARLGIPVEALRIYNGAISGTVPPGGTVALPIPGLRLHYGIYDGFRESWMGPVYVSAEPGRSLLPYDEMSPWSVPTLELMWQGLTPLEREIEYALRLTAEDAAAAAAAPFDNVLTFDEAMGWITQNAPNITAISARFDVEPSLVAGILASEMLYDYGTFDVIPDRLGLGQGSGYASAHDTTLIPAIRHLENLYGTDNPWLRDALAPRIKRSDEEPREFEFVTDPTSYTLTDTGAIAAAAVVARYYADHFIDYTSIMDATLSLRDRPAHLPEDELYELALAEVSQRRHQLSVREMAVTFGAYRAGVGDIEPYGTGFDSIQQFRDAAQHLGANALLALPLMRYFEEEMFR